MRGSSHRQTGREGHGLHLSAQCLRHPSSSPKCQTRQVITEGFSGQSLAGWLVPHPAHRRIMELSATPAALQSIKPTPGQKLDYGSGKGGQCAELLLIIPWEAGAPTFRLSSVPPNYPRLPRGPGFQICYLDCACMLQL